MINFNGYYIEEPTEVYDGRSKGNESFYLFNAYLFLEECRLLITSKHDYLKDLTDFTKSNFEPDKCIEKNIGVFENSIIVKKSSLYSNDVLIKIETPQKLYNTVSKKRMYFISWAELNQAENEMIGAPVLNKIFGPFFHKKFQVSFV
jgi:hypothetical protein